MFCKLCGNPVDRKSMKCVSCGKPLGSLTGGNSFKDILQEKACVPGSAVTESGSFSPQFVRISSDIRDIKEKYYTQKTDFTAIISALGVLICIIVLVSSFALYIGNKKSLDQIRESLAMQINETNQKIDSLGLLFSSTAGNKNVSPDVSSSEFFFFDKNPESEFNVTPGKTSVAFVCRALGNDLQFSWIKYSHAENKWITIEQDSSQFAVMSSSNESNLTVIEAGPEHEGTYICVVKDENGIDHYSAPAQFSLSAVATVDPGNTDSAQADSTASNAGSNNSSQAG